MSFASVAVTTLTYLWLDLRATRARLLDLQRAPLALDEQLRLASRIQRSLLPAIPHATAGYSLGRGDARRTSRRGFL